MTPQEKDLIQGVFDRLARNSVGQKDAEADALIRDNLRRQPDAVYALVQTVVVQEMGLNQATAQLHELQRQLDEARVASQGHPSGAGFLPSGPSPWGGGSVPRSGQGYAPPPQQQPAPWAQPAGPAPGYAAAPQAMPQAPQAQPPSPVGGFLRNAATMAAGVAGGALIAQGLSSMFGGHNFGGGYGGGFGGGFGGAGPWGGGGGTVENVTVNNYYDERSGQAGADSSRDASYDAGQDNGYQDASYDDSQDAGFDDGGFDDSQDI